MVLLEAMATGLPVIANNQVLAAGDRAGWQIRSAVPSGDPKDWAGALRWATSQPEALAAMGQHGRRAFEISYTPERGYRLLSDIYRRTVERASSQFLSK